MPDKIADTRDLFVDKSVIFRKPKAFGQLDESELSAPAVRVFASCQCRVLHLLILLIRQAEGDVS